MAEVIAVFPLTHVLLPGMPLPLHIFEPRYRQLLADVTQSTGGPSFGVVALRRGSEVGESEPQVMDVGTLAEILEVEPGEDGTSDLLTVGSRRFRINELLTAGTPYLRAEVEWLDEADGDLRPGQVAVTRRLAQDYAGIVEVLTGRVRDNELPTDPTMLSYHIAGHLPLSPGDRQAMLEKPTAAARLQLAIALLRREVALLQRTRSIAIAPSVLRLAAHPN